MPITVKTAKEASENQFISGLYLSEYHLVELKRLKKNPERDMNEQLQHWEAAFKNFKLAIEHAFIKVSIARDFIERVDFKDWLVGSKIFIARRMVMLAQLHPDQDRDITESVYNSVLRITNEWLTRIDEVSKTLDSRLTNAWDEPTARQEMERISGLLTTLTGRRVTTVSEHYVAHFYSYLESLGKALLTRALTFNSYDEQFISTHYNTVKTILGGNNQKLQAQWQQFTEVIKFVRMQPSSEEQVKAAIKLRAKWDEITMVEKIIENCKAMIKKVNEWRKEKLAKLPSIAKRILGYLTTHIGGGIGIALSPILLPILGVANIACKKVGISVGERAFKGYLENTLTNKSAWLGLLYLGSLAIGVAVPILHPLIPSVMGKYAGELIISGGILAVGGGAVYRHVSDKKMIEYEEKTKIEEYKTKAKLLEERIRSSATDFITDLEALDASDQNIEEQVRTLMCMRQRQERRPSLHADVEAERSGRRQQRPR